MNVPIRPRGRLDRRTFLRQSGAFALLGGAVASTVHGQEASSNANEPGGVFRAVEINHISLDAPKFERSVEFYQSMFGMTNIPHFAPGGPPPGGGPPRGDGPPGDRPPGGGPPRGGPGGGGRPGGGPPPGRPPRDGGPRGGPVPGGGPLPGGALRGGAFLHMEEGFLNLRFAEAAAMNHFCLAIENFRLDAIYDRLAKLGHEPFTMGGGNLLHCYDPDHLNVQIQEIGHGYARTRGQLTNSGKGVLDAIRLHHVALSVTDVPRSRKFYHDLFGLEVLSGGESDESCRLAVGKGYLALHKADRPGMRHYGLAVRGFDAATSREALEKNGVKIRETANKHVLAFRDPQNLLVTVNSAGRTRAG